MRLTRLVGDCPDGKTCPTIYTTDRGTVVIQGYTLGDADLSGLVVPDAEALVEIPASLLLKAADAERC
jgi:hypothetical protein